MPGSQLPTLRSLPRICQRRFRMCQKRFRLIDIRLWLPYNQTNPLSSPSVVQPSQRRIAERSRSMLNLAILLELNARRDPGKVAVLVRAIEASGCDHGLGDDVPDAGRCRRVEV